MDIERIDPPRARTDLTTGSALLVCGYDSQEKCARMHLDGAWSLHDLEALEPDLPRSREIVFYCA